MGEATGETTVCVMAITPRTDPYGRGYGFTMERTPRHAPWLLLWSGVGLWF